MAARPTWWRLEAQTARFAASMELASEGARMARMATMMVTTTRSSISVKARRAGDCGFRISDCGFENMGTRRGEKAALTPTLPRGEGAEDQARRRRVARARRLR